MAKGYKTGGRQKGSNNKISIDVRELLKELLNKELSNLDKHLENVNQKDRLDFIIKILPYVLPRYDNISQEVVKQENKISLFEQITKSLIESN